MLSTFSVENPRVGGSIPSLATIFRPVTSSAYASVRCFVTPSVDRVCPKCADQCDVNLFGRNVATILLATFKSLPRLDPTADKKIFHTTRLKGPKAMSSMTNLNAPLINTVPNGDIHRC
jgi:hypothetical protein